MIDSSDYNVFTNNLNWIRVRDKVVERDNHKCKICGSTSNLNVHHLIYQGKCPWDTDMKYMITVCKDCHEKIHKDNLDTSMFLFGVDIYTESLIVKVLHQNDMVVDKDKAYKYVCSVIDNTEFDKALNKLIEFGLVKLHNDVIIGTPREYERCNPKIYKYEWWKYDNTAKREMKKFDKEVNESVEKKIKQFLGL